MSEDSTKKNELKPKRKKEMVPDSPVERRTGRDRRKGVERRSGFDRRRDLNQKAIERKNLTRE